MTKTINNWTVDLDVLQTIKDNNMFVEVADKLDNQPVTIDNLFKEAITRDALGGPILFSKRVGHINPEHIKIRYLEPGLVAGSKDIAVSLRYKEDLLAYRTDGQIEAELS